MNQLPHDLNAEAAVLSAMMNDKICIPVAMEALEDKHFYKTEHKKLFGIMTYLFDNNTAIDLLTVIDQIKQKSYNITNEYISNLSDMVLSGGNVKYHIKIIKDKFYRRELIMEAKKIQANSVGSDIETGDLIDKSKKAILSIGMENQNTVHKTSEIIVKTLETIENNCSHDDGFGVKTGQVDVDNILGIIKPHHYVIISAASGCGKTIEAGQIAWHNAFARKKNVVYFAFEMGYDELFLREISRQTRISYEKLENGWLTDDDHAVIEKVTTRMGKAKIIIDDKTGQSAEEIRSKIMMILNEMSIDLVVIDFIQMAKTIKADKRHEALTEFSRALKAINKDFGIPIIATAQVNSEGELGEAKNMIQPADKHLHITRPHYQKHKFVFIDGVKHEPPPEELAIFDIRKNRAGKTGKVKQTFNGDNQEFVSW